MTELEERSLLALEKSAEVERQRDELRSQSKPQAPRSFQGVDADKGAVIMGAAGGGQAQAVEQGDLSNSAIQTGKSIRSYDDQAVDWNLTESAVGGEDITPRDDPTSYEEQKQDGNPDDVPDDAPGLDDPNDNEESYCACRTIWVRGTPNRDAPDYISEPFEGGQCVGDNYFVNGEYENEVTGLQAYEILSIGEITSIQIIGGVDHDTLRIVDTGGTRTRDFFETVSVPGTIIFSDITRQDGGSDSCGNNPNGQRDPETGPDASADPGAWDSYISCNPPVGVTERELNNKVHVVIEDATGIIAVLGYEPGEYQSRVRCSEEGPP